jgi:hypothetical protein
LREVDYCPHNVRLLRQLIVLLAVIIAVPVILWTIRTYVSPLRIPTFHQVAPTARINAPSPLSSSDAAAQLSQDATHSFELEASALVSMGIEALKRGDGGKYSRAISGIRRRHR